MKTNVQSNIKNLPIRINRPDIGFEAKHTCDMPRNIASTHLKNKHLLIQNNKDDIIYKSGALKSDDRPKDH